MLLPTIVLFEFQWTNAFPAVRGGIESVLGLRPKSWTNHPEDPHPRPYPFRIHRRRSGSRFIVLPANHSKRLCRPIQFLRIERFSFLPDSQRYGRDLASQCQPRHLFANALVLQRLQVTPIGFGLASTRSRTDEDVFHAAIAIAVESSSGDRLSASYDTTLLELIFGTHMGDHRQPAITP